MWWHSSLQLSTTHRRTVPLSFPLCNSPPLTAGPLPSSFPSTNSSTPNQMRGSKVKNLSSLFLSALAQNSPKPSTKPPKLQTLTTISSSTYCSTSTSSSKRNKASKKPKAAKKLSATQCELPSKNNAENYEIHLNNISSILKGSNLAVLKSQKVPAPKDVDDDKSASFSSTPQPQVLHHQKEQSRDRKQQWIFKNTQIRRFDKLVSFCGQKLGAKATLEVFGKLGRETGLKEYNALVGLCVEKARTSQGEEVCSVHIHRAFQLLQSMKEQGFQLEEKTYGPLLMYLIDMGMAEDFHLIIGTIKDENFDTRLRLGYYEMLLLIRTNNNDKIQELCDFVAVDNDNGERRSQLAESYMLALCENDKKKELLQLLEVVGITKVSLECVLCIFKFLGRLLLESFAVKFIRAFRTSEVEEETISYLICNYATSMANLAVEDTISKFRDLHERLGVIPSFTSYEKLVTYCCDLFKVHAALDLVDQMCQLGLTPSIEILNPILRAVEETRELDLVRPIYSVICRHNLKVHGDTFRSLINLCVKMKDFEGAYTILTYLKSMGIKPTTNMYNAILLGYYREKNVYGASMVINQMKHADVKPDSLTYSYFIGNCESEKDISKYLEEFQHAGVDATKHIYMSLINAYVSCGLIEKAKQVVLDKGISVKNINEIKSVLLSALASCGQMSDALKYYEEIKQAECKVEPKAIISLIEYLQSEGELNRLLLLLEEIKDSDFWFDGCERVVSYCIRYEHLSSAIDLLKRLKDRDDMFVHAVLDQAFCQISETDPTALDIGMDLLQAVKEDLKLHPSRTSLDFLLAACVSAKDTIRGRLIWHEYQKGGLSANVLTYLRMYQLFLASGEMKAAYLMLKKVPKNDPHVRCIISACRETFSTSNSKGNTGDEKQSIWRLCSCPATIHHNEGM